MNKYIKFRKQVTNLYIHIPFCIKKCHFCAFPIYAVGEHSPQSAKQKLYELYVDNLLKQIKAVSQFSQFCPKIQSLYLGGGTPSLLKPSHMKIILQQFQPFLTTQTEVTLQTNIQQLYKAEDFMKLGVNRFSVGIQTLNQQTLKEFNRQQITKNALQNLKYLRKRQKLAMNLDFIIDFNHDQKDQCSMLSIIQQIRPQHLSMYILQINEQSFLGKQANIHKFRNKIQKFNHYSQICSKLSQLNYDHYQVSNFAQKSYQSKHNRTYWKGNKEFGAFGMGATSFLNGYRVTRPKTISKYYEYIQNLSKDQQNNNNLLCIHDQNSLKQQLTWVVLSRLRTKQGFSWFDISQIIQRKCKKQGLQFGNWKQKCLQVINDISQSNHNIIDQLWIDSGVRVKIPEGFLFVDEIGYRLLECFKLQNQTYTN